MKIVLIFLLLFCMISDCKKLKPKCNCGLPTSKTRNDRIFRGHDALPHEYPWQIRLHPIFGRDTFGQTKFGWPYLVQPKFGPVKFGPTHFWSNPFLVKPNLVEPKFGPAKFGRTQIWSSQIWSNRFSC